MNLFFVIFGKVKQGKKGECGTVAHGSECSMELLLSIRTSTHVLRNTDQQLTSHAPAADSVK